VSRPPSELPADARLHELWREASKDEPPAALDDAIRAAARQAVRARPRPLGSGPFGGRWRVPLSVAAVVVVSATVTLLVVEERGALLSRHEVTVAPINGAPGSGALERHREEPAPARQFSEPLSPAPAASPAPREPEMARALPPASEERKKSSPAASPPAVQAERPAAQTHAMERSSAESAALAPSQKAGAAEADAERAQRDEAAPGAADAVAPEQAVSRSDTLLRDAPAPASAPSAEAAKREMQAPVRAGQAGDAGASATAKLQARAQENAPGRQPVPGAFPAAPPVKEAPPLEESVADAQTLEPKAWVERILELRRQGRVEEAAKSLKAFRERYPAYPLPPELKSLP
jgi:hypothetical protein